uniref:Virion structural protein n=1 Tax=Klebsiella phage KpTRp1 TaxID=3236632 RepID=A0AB39AJ67_9CAUD
MSVTTYEVLSANTISELVALVNAATGKTPLGEIFIRGGAPRQVVVTGEPVSGYISNDYQAVVGVDPQGLADAVMAVMTNEIQPLGAPIIRNNTMIQMMGTVTPSSGGSVAWDNITGKPTVIAAGADAAAARTAIGAGTSSLVIGTTASTAMAGDKFTQGSAVPNVDSQTVSGLEAASVATSATTAVNVVATKLNDLLTQLRASGIIASN